MTMKMTMMMKMMAGSERESGRERESIVATLPGNIGALGAARMAEYMDSLPCIIYINICLHNNPIHHQLIIQISRSAGFKRYPETIPPARAAALRILEPIIASANRLSLSLSPGILIIFLLILGLPSSSFSSSSRGNQITIDGAVIKFDCILP